MAAKKTTKKTVADEPVEQNVLVDVEQPVKEEFVKTEKAVKRATATKIKRLPLDIEIPCTNNTHGELVYKSTRSGGLDTDWDEYGSVQYMDLRELMQMRNTAKRFFTDNWIVVGDTDDGEYTAEDIYNYLKVNESYNDFYSPDNVDDFFSLNEKQMKDKASRLSKGMIDLLSVIALEKMDAGEIDSVSKIRGIETALGIKLNKEEG